jgi:hypothetical protein
VYLPRLTFLSHFVLCLACAALAFFAWDNGVPQAIWTNDMSMMTSVIGALFVSSAVWLGWEAWRIGEPTSVTNYDPRAKSRVHRAHRESKSNAPIL